MSKFRHYFDFQSLEASAAVYPASSALPCHLCSLILGRILHAEQQQRVAIPSGPVNVAFTVSRSGGVTLDIEIGENSNRREIGELILRNEIGVSLRSIVGNRCAVSFGLCDVL